jgi:hypothetical protein
MPIERSNTLRKSATYLAILTGLGVMGFVGGGVATATSGVAEACEDEVCVGQDCDIKAGWNCDEEPLCTHTQCPVN